MTSACAGRRQRTRTSKLGSRDIRAASSSSSLGYPSRLPTCSVRYYRASTGARLLTIYQRPCGRCWSPASHPKETTRALILSRHNPALVRHFCFFPFCPIESFNSISISAISLLLSLPVRSLCFLLNPFLLRLLAVTDVS